MKKIIIFLAVLVVALAGLFFYVRNQMYFSHGSYKQSKIFEIKKGEGNSEIASRLETENIVASKYAFYIYLRSHGMLNKILPGEYELSGTMSVPEIAYTITQDKNRFIKVTFPEGWDSKKIAERLKANNLDGDGFLKIVASPGEIKNSYPFLKDAKSLEGYLFPDTYFFRKNEDPSSIATKMLDNFNQKFDEGMRQEAESQGKSVSEIVTLASIIEKEVTSQEDREIASGIFLNRMKNGQPLQSCATIAYILGINKKQYSYADTRIVSPFNTYLNKGLTPAPIDNPGLSSLNAALHPKATDYNYFLSDPDSGKTIFSKTIQEHNANKAKYGL